MAETNTKRARAVVVSAIVASAILVTILLGVAGVRRWKAFTARKHHESMLLVIDACKQHLLQNDGQWPTGWHEITPLCKSIDHWDVRNSISIDFAADPARLAFEHARNFSGLQPRFKPRYSYKKELSDLIDVLRDYYPPEMA